jgi:K+-sensing histidine kinase KdpD
MRNQHYDIDWHAPESLPGVNIPSALFDCVVDNLLDNVVRKRQSEPNLKIVVDLRLEPLCLSVSDDGAPVPIKLASTLLHGVVISEGGLGIGLYQAARWAEQLGYSLTLASNQEGRVCFELRR